MRAFAGARGGAPDVSEPEPKALKFFPAMIDLFKLVARSGAPQLRLRLVAAIVLTVGGKLTGVMAPLLLGKAVNGLSHHAAVETQVAWTFAGLAGWQSAVRGEPGRSQSYRSTLP